MSEASKSTAHAAALRRGGAIFAVVLSIYYSGLVSAAEFRNVVTGALLDVKSSQAKTPAAKEFLETGKNPYNGDTEALKKGEQEYLGACSGCHGHHAEGKLGPGLADDYWTYPTNKADAGLFSTIWGGAQAMMGPQEGFMSIDRVLLAMAWVRHLGEENAKKKK